MRKSERSNLLIIALVRMLVTQTENYLAIRYQQDLSRDTNNNSKSKNCSLRGREYCEYGSPYNSVSEPDKILSEYFCATTSHVTSRLPCDRQTLLWPVSQTILSTETTKIFLIKKSHKNVLSKRYSLSFRATTNTTKSSVLNSPAFAIRSNSNFQQIAR